MQTFEDRVEARRRYWMLRRIREKSVVALPLLLVGVGLFLFVYFAAGFEISGDGGISSAPLSFGKPAWGFRAVYPYAERYGMAAGAGLLGVGLLLCRKK